MSHILYQALSNPCGFGSATLEKTRNACTRTYAPLALDCSITGSFHKCQGTEGNNLVKFHSLNNMMSRDEKDFEGCHFAAYSFDIGNRQCVLTQCQAVILISQGRPCQGEHYSSDGLLFYETVYGTEKVLF
jgi:hypothetical protein